MSVPASFRIRTAAVTDLPELRRVFRAASLSNADDAPLLLARPEYLEFAGDGIAERRTRVATGPAQEDSSVLGFASVTTDADGELELEDLFVDPPWQRRGLARALVLDAARRASGSGHARLLVTANPHAMAFYRAVGFVDLGARTTELGSGRRMQLDLRPDSPSSTPSF